MEIVERKNPVVTKTTPAKETMQTLVPGIVDKNIPGRNGSLVCLCGAGGSGKSSLLLNLFKQRNYYRGVFHNVWYLIPETSFLSCANTPFKNHNKVIHELTPQVLQEIYDNLVSIKDSRMDGDEVEYSAIVIDDFANRLKDREIEKCLNDFAMKLRQLCACMFICTQAYFYIPKRIREQLTYAIIFRPRNVTEFQKISGELVKLDKEEARGLFDFTFDKEYNYLGIDLCNGKFYKNNNELQITIN